MAVKKEKQVIEDLGVQHVFELDKTYVVNSEDKRVKLWNKSYDEDPRWLKYFPKDRRLVRVQVEKHSYEAEELQRAEGEAKLLREEVRTLTRENQILNGRLATYGERDKLLDGWAQHVFNRPFRDIVSEVEDRGVSGFENTASELMAESPQDSQVYEMIMADLEDIPGASMAPVLLALRKRFQTLAALKMATSEQLTEISGVGPTRAEKILERVKAMTTLDMTIENLTGTAEEVDAQFEEFAAVE